MLVYRLWFFSFILLFCTLATVYFCFFLFCLFVLFMGGAWLTRSFSGRGAFVSSLRRENSISDWEGCGVTNDINERLMQTHINLVFFIPFPNPNFFKGYLVIWQWRNNLKQIRGFFGQNIGGGKKWATALKIFSFRKIKQICWDDSF